MGSERHLDIGPPFIDDLRTFGLAILSRPLRTPFMVTLVVTALPGTRRSQ